MNEGVNGAGNAGSQVDLDWPEIDAAQEAADGRAGASGRADAAGNRYLTDEEILGMEPAGSSGRASGTDENAGRDSGQDARRQAAGQKATSDVTDAAAASRPGKADQGAAMPAWMQTLAGDPRHGAEAQQLWQDHQAFREAFSTPQEAREIKELFPGGAQDARALRQASQAV